MNNEVSLEEYQDKIHSEPKQIDAGTNRRRYSPPISCYRFHDAVSSPCCSQHV
jgi:hypothetical protein